MMAVKGTTGGRTGKNVLFLFCNLIVFVSGRISLGKSDQMIMIVIGPQAKSNFWVFVCFLEEAFLL